MPILSFLTLSLDVEIIILGVLRPQEVDFSHKNCYGDKLGVYRPIFPTMSTLALLLKILFEGVLKYQKVISILPFVFSIYQRVSVT